MSATRCSSERRLAAPLLALCLLGMLLAPLLAPAPLLAQTSAPAPAAAAPPRGGRRGQPSMPDVGAIQLPGMSGRTLLLGRARRLRAGPGLRARDLQAAQEHAGARVDARDLRADLRDLQDLSDHAGQVLLILEVFIGVIIVLYFGVLLHFEADARVLIILLFSLIGIAGSYGVAWFGIRINTFANSRTAFASLRGKPYPVYAIPLQGRA